MNRENVLPWDWSFCILSGAALLKTMHGCSVSLSRLSLRRTVPFKPNLIELSDTVFYDILLKFWALSKSTFAAIMLASFSICKHIKCLPLCKSYLKNCWKSVDSKLYGFILHFTEARADGCVELQLVRVTKQLI